MHLELSPDLGATWVAAACDATGKLQTAAGGGGGGGLSVTAGAAVGTLVTPVGGSDGTNAQFLRTDTSGNLFAVGNVASGVADAGNPVKMGGKANQGTPASTANGNRVDAWYGVNGQQIVCIMTGSTAGDGALARVGMDLAGNLAIPPFAMMGFSNASGSGWDRVRLASVIKTVAAVAITAGTGATIWTPAAGKKFRLMGWSLSVSAGASLIFGDNLVGTVILRTELQAAAGISQNPHGFGNGYLSAAANNVLKLDATATATVSGYVFGTEE